jgi:hypothetical protein
LTRCFISCRLFLDSVAGDTQGSSIDVQHMKKLFCLGKAVLIDEPFDAVTTDTCALAFAVHVQPALICTIS